MNHASSRLPIWYQLFQLVRSDILAGRLSPGQRIEPEVRLAEQHGISVIPVRQALRALEEEGLIVRQRGRGTFVSQSTKWKINFVTSMQSLYAWEFARPAVILGQGFVPVPHSFASFFEGKGELGFVRRLAYRDDKPWSFGTLYYPKECAEKLTTERLERYPIYRLLHELYDVELVRSHFEAKAIAATGEVAAGLEMEPFSAALSLSCVTFDAADNAVGAFELVFPGEPFVFSFDTPHRLA